MGDDIVVDVVLLHEPFEIILHLLRHDGLATDLSVICAHGRVSVLPQIARAKMATDHMMITWCSHVSKHTQKSSAVF